MTPAPDATSPASQVGGDHGSFSQEAKIPTATDGSTVANHRRKPNMTKLTSTTAMRLVERIEALNEEIEQVYAEARTYDGQNNDHVIRDAVALRKTQRDVTSEAESLIGSFDWEDDA